MTVTAKTPMKHVTRRRAPVSRAVRLATREWPVRSVSILLARFLTFMFVLGEALLLPYLFSKLTFSVISSQRSLFLVYEYILIFLQIAGHFDICL